MKVPCVCKHDLDEHYGVIAWLKEKNMPNADDFDGGKAVACWLGHHIHPCQFMRCKCKNFVLDNLRYVEELSKEPKKRGRTRRCSFLRGTEDK